MLIKQVMEIFDLLDSPSASGEEVARELERRGPAEITVRTIRDGKNSTDFIRIAVAGRAGKTAGGAAPTLGIVGRLGGIAASEALYTPVRFKNGVRGVFVKEEKAELKGLKLDSCYDIGAADQDAAKKLVQVGDTAVYDTPTILNGDKVISPYLDNRIACAVLLEVLARLDDCPNDLYLVFSVQEEVGTRGAKTAAWAIDPDYALAVDVTDVDDTPGSERCGTVQLGKGAAIKVMDSSVICHPAVVSALEQAAKTAGIPVQKDIMRAGGTDAGAIHTTHLGVLTGGVSIPCRYIHTPVEMADLNDAKHCADLLLAFMGRKLEPMK